jgi:hypothetical protein
MEARTRRANQTKIRRMIKRRRLTEKKKKKKKKTILVGSGDDDNVNVHSAFLPRSKVAEEGIFTTRRKTKK